MLRAMQIYNRLPERLKEYIDEYIYMKYHKYNNDKMINELKVAIEPPSEITDKGKKFWKNDVGQYHRDLGYPAIIYSNQTSKSWFTNGKHIMSVYKSIHYNAIIRSLT